MLRRKQGAFAQAAGPFEEAIAILEKSETRLSLGRALEERSLLRREQGDEAGASADAQRAGRLYQECGILNTVDQ